MNDKDGKFRASYDKYSSGSLHNTERHETLFPEKEEKSEPTTVKGIVCNAQNVNIRTKPRFDSKVICVKPAGTKVEILGKMPDFYKISLMDYPGRELYISSKFCKEV